MSIYRDPEEALLALPALLLALLLPAIPSASGPSADAGSRLEKEGLVIRFSMERPGLSAGATAAPLREGEHAVVSFRITSAASGEPVRGLTPAAWMDPAAATPEADPERACKEKVGLYLRGMIGVRPALDLNGYHLLVLNADPSISVIDPVVGMTGKTSLFASVLLRRPGADWLLSADRKRLFVSMPLAGQVAVVDAERFKVEANVAAGKHPTRLALEPGGRHLWVGNDVDRGDGSGVTVIDAGTLEPVAWIPTGRGHHEIAFSDRHAFVTSRTEGTVTVVDLATREKVKTLAIGPAPISIAWSPLARAIHVAEGREGRIAVIDPERLEVTSRIDAKPGLGPMRFAPGGRFGLVVNTAEHAVHVVDASDQSLVATIPVGGAPYQVTFTRAFAYVRLLDSERMALVHLDQLGPGKKPVVQHVSLGSKAPKLVPDLSIADAVVPGAIDSAVFAVSPADNATYFYMEGMNAPAGSFGGYGHASRAVLVVDRSVTEVEPGVYSARVRVPAAGAYQVGFVLDAPRVVHCFRTSAERDPALAATAGPLALEQLSAPPRPVAGAAAPLRVRLTDPATRSPRTGLTDVKVLAFVAPGELRTELAAREIGDGVYEVPFAPARAGAWYVYVGVPSLGVKYGDLPYRTVVVRGGSTPLTGKAAPDAP